MRRLLWAIPTLFVAGAVYAGGAFYDMRTGGGGLGGIATGNIDLGGLYNLSDALNIELEATSLLTWEGRAQLDSPSTSAVRIRNSANSANADLQMGAMESYSGATVLFYTVPGSNLISAGSAQHLAWANAAGANQTKDVGLKRSAAGILQVSNGSSGDGGIDTGSLYVGLVTKATADSPYTVAAGDNVILCNTVGGSLTLNLPTAASSTGRILQVKKIDAANTCTIEPDGAELLDGAANLGFTTNYQSYTITSSGTAWFIL
jgi:hypothetical protein